MHILDLYTQTDMDLPLSAITIQKNGEEHILGRAYACITPGSDIFEVKNGTNPRDVNGESLIVASILKTLLEETGFGVHNGGICVVIDNGSFKYDSKAKQISFTCNQPGSGHYDGAHTREALRQGADRAVNQQFSLTFIENSFFEDEDEVRRTAERWNKRNPQKPHSEQNQRGVFDVLKTFLDEGLKDNIAWVENRRDPEGIIIPKECRIDRLVSLMYTAVPVLRSEYLDAGDEMYNVLRRGYNSAKILEEENKRADFERLYPHANLIAGLCDHIQTNLRTSFDRNCGAGESFENLAIVRKAGKRDLNKPVAQRKFFSQRQFNGTKTSEALAPDYLQPIMYGLLRNVLKLDRTTGAVILAHGLTQHDVEQIWDEAGYGILAELDKRFVKYFKARFNSRHAEFAAWSNLWDICKDVFEDVIDSGSWKNSAAAA